MDIEEYIGRKRELEKKKEILEAEEKLNNKRSRHVKKDIEVKRRREITRVEESDDPPPRRHHSHHKDHPKKGEGIQWIFLGLAFFVALLIIGIYFISQYMNSPADEEKELTEVEKLQKQIINFKKNKEKFF